jgi:hypothetical protein
LDNASTAPDRRRSHSVYKPGGINCCSAGHPPPGEELIIDPNREHFFALLAADHLNRGGLRWAGGDFLAHLLNYGG